MTTWMAHWLRRVAAATARPAMLAMLPMTMAMAMAMAMAALLPGLASAAETLVATPQGSSLADKVAQAKDGDTIELLPGDYTDTLLLTKRRLTFRGMGKAVVKGTAEARTMGNGRALWTVQGGDIVIENIEFRGVRASDGGGAGVRLDSGSLTLRRCQFFDNEHGLTTGNDPQAQVLIENSVFGLAPKVVGGLYHLVDVGRIGKLQISGSRFQQGFEGHLIKSRARETTIAYNFVHDGVRGGASYEIDIANGGVATIIGNVIGQGVDNQNPVLVAYGTEGRAWEKNALYLAHNTLVTYSWMPAWFLRTFVDRLPPGTEIHAVNNLVVGPGIFSLGASGRFDGNRNATRGMLRDIWTYGFELPPGSMWRNSGVDPRRIDGQDLSPKAEFDWPVGTKPLTPGRTQWSPGAYQR